MGWTPHHSVSHTPAVRLRLEPRPQTREKVFFTEQKLRAAHELPTNSRGEGASCKCGPGAGRRRQNAITRSGAARGRGASAVRASAGADGVVGPVGEPGARAGDPRPVGPVQHVRAPRAARPRRRLGAPHAARRVPSPSLTRIRIHPRLCSCLQPRSLCVARGRAYALLAAVAPRRDSAAAGKRSGGRARSQRMRCGASSLSRGARRSCAIERASRRSACPFAALRRARPRVRRLLFSKGRPARRAATGRTMRTCSQTTAKPIRPPRMRSRPRRPLQRIRPRGTSPLPRQTLSSTSRVSASATTRADARAACVPVRVLRCECC